MSATYFFTELLELKGTSEDIQPDPITIRKRKLEREAGEGLVQGPFWLLASLGWESTSLADYLCFLAHSL